MPLPILPLAVAAGAAWYLLSRKEDYPTVPAPEAGANKVSTTIPTPDGKGMTIITDAMTADIMLRTASTADPAACDALAETLAKQGKASEAAAMRGLAKILRDYQAGLVPKADVGLGAADLARIQAAITSQDPAQMRAVAKDLRARGFIGQALSLENAAAAVEAVEKQQASTPSVVVTTPPALPQTATVPTVPMAVPLPTAPPSVVVTPPALPQATVPTPVIPSAPTAPVVTPTKRRLAADALVKHLTVNPPGKRKEDKTLVAIYQKAAGLKDDGLMGPGTARSLNEPGSGGHVPPAPRRWPSGTYTQALKDYKTWLLEQKLSDPARAAEWDTAITHAKDFWP